LPLGFTGEQRDAESGLVSLRARYLDPATGRFLTKDPFPGVAADPASQQPYPYAHNAPTALTDPGGMSPFASLGGAGQSGAGGDASLCGGDDLVSLLLSDPRDLVTGEQIKAALGVLSLVPGLGTPASAVGALLYAADGDYANAALAGLGVLPVAGIAAKLGVGALALHGGLLAAHGIGHVGFAAGVVRAERYVQLPLDIGQDTALVRSSEIHHIATNKTKGGYTAQFKAIFARAGMTLDDPANKVALPGHGQHPLGSPHAQSYHQYILDQLRVATSGLSDQDYAQALRAKLGDLRAELLQNPGMVKGVGLP
jgi:RHS repeat-associated protein